MSRYYEYENYEEPPPPYEEVDCEYGQEGNPDYSSNGYDSSGDDSDGCDLDGYDSDDFDSDAYDSDKYDSSDLGSDTYESYESGYGYKDVEPPKSSSDSKTRKVVGTMKIVLKKCRTCGNPGHDSRTCALNKDPTGNSRRPKQRPAPSPRPPPPPKMSRPSKRAEERACGACREIGHDRRACPRLISASDHQKHSVVTTAMQTLMQTMAVTAATSATGPKKQTARSNPGKVRAHRGGSSDRGGYVRTVETVCRMERGEDNKNKGKKPQTARKTTHASLSAQGSRGGAGVTKKKTAPGSGSRRVNFMINL
ncbi:hypothetical protein TWF730_001018 [Orbilia blumenaviensis]|uniref:CCHC-type domain-containing protein n=1 Tax=Orbilia blumenaviensis TaxID=1796055 RepID=A0AAV9VNC7_9PEZI